MATIMKVKHSIIPFIPIVLAMVVLKIMSIFAVDSNGLLFGMNKISVSYLTVILALGLFVVCVFLNLFDRKTAPVYKVKKNYFSGIFAILFGIAVAGSSFITLMNTTKDNTDYYFMSIIVAAFSIPACIAFVIMSKAHFSGKTSVSGVSMLYIFPALWGCCALVYEFLSETKVSVSATDMTSLFCYIFITLYLFSYAMIVARVKGRNPVKACFIYGLPAIALSLSYGVYEIVTAVYENTGIQNIVIGAQFVIFAIYAVSFIIEMFTGTLTKDEVEIIDSLPEEEDTYENSYIKSGAYDELLKSSDDSNEKESDPSFDYLGDFVTGYKEDNDMQFSGQKPDMLDSVIMDSGSQKTPDLVEDILAQAAARRAQEQNNNTDENAEKANVTEASSAPLQKEAESDTEAKQEPVDEAKEKASVKVEPKPVLDQNSAEQVKTAENDLSSDDLISRDRLSQIDRLLAELEDKK